MGVLGKKACEAEERPEIAPSAWDMDAAEVTPFGNVVFYAALALSTVVAAAGLFEIVRLVRQFLS